MSQTIIEEEKRVLVCIANYGDHRDGDGPLVAALMKRRLIKHNDFEDYVGYALTRQGQEAIKPDR